MADLRVLSFNIHKGVNFLTWKGELVRLKKFIQQAQANLVFLQEIRGEPQVNNPQSQQSTQFEFLADSIWSHYAYGKNAVYESGHHGNAVLSEFPILQYENTDISNNRFERRGLLYAAIQPKNCPTLLHLFCVHLDLLPWGRTRQIKKIIDVVQSKVPPSAPLIIAGDFNDWTHSASQPLYNKLGLIDAHKSIHGIYAKTFPSFLPSLSLDRIYIRGIKVTDCSMLSNSLSDHCALRANINLSDST